MNIHKAIINLETKAVEELKLVEAVLKKEFHAVVHSKVEQAVATAVENLRKHVTDLLGGTTTPPALPNDAATSSADAQSVPATSAGTSSASTSQDAPTAGQ